MAWPPTADDAQTLIDATRASMLPGLTAVDYALSSLTFHACASQQVAAQMAITAVIAQDLERVSEELIRLRVALERARDAETDLERACILDAAHLAQGRRDV